MKAQKVLALIEVDETMLDLAKEYEVDVSKVCENAIENAYFKQKIKTIVQYRD